MLESAEPFQVAFDKLDIEDPSYLEYFGADYCPPNFDDWDKARAFMKFLKIFYDATKFFFQPQLMYPYMMPFITFQNTH
jgi:hypothetical protein